MFKPLFDFDDILLEPTVLSEISSRKKINPYYNNHLPLMTAPMDTVINENNALLFHQNKIINVLPRHTQLNTDLGQFLSYGLDEFVELYITTKKTIVNHDYVLIDVANGHMNKLYFAAYEAKKHYKDKLVLMIGNVANPQTFDQYCRINVDYIRIGIGNGGGCLTTVQTGVGYPMASLIKECRDKKRTQSYKTKIVADGGFKKYSDVIKALALGADYVMLGSIFNKALESAGETIRDTSMRDDDGFAIGQIIDQYSDEALNMFNAGIILRKTFRGMSTKEVQKLWGKENFTTSEGVVKSHKVEYTLEGWVKNFEDYLRSAMSYCGKKELHEFIGGVQYNLITQNAFKRFDK
jgi:GMP reductase